MEPLLIVMIIIGGLSKLYRKFVPVSLGLELKTFFTIVIAYAIDPWVAIISSIIMIIIAAVIAQRFCHWIGIKVLFYIVVSILVGMFAPLGVTGAGKIAVLFLNGAYLLTNALMKDFRIWTDLPGNLINIVSNFFLLSVFGNTMVQFLI